MSKYEEQANDFLDKTNTDFEIKFLRTAPYFNDDDKTKRDIYYFIFTRNGHSYASEFGDSIANTKNNIGRKLHHRGRQYPSAYDVLSCLTKYEPPFDAWEFAEEFGYEIHNKTDFRKVEDTFLAVTKEYAGVCLLWGDVMDELREIE